MAAARVHPAFDAGRAVRLEGGMEGVDAPLP
jgi:hypothetical protein